MPETVRPLNLVEESRRAHMLYTSGVVVLAVACLGLAVAAWGFGWAEGYAATVGVAVATAFTLLAGGFHTVTCQWRSRQ